MLNKKETHPLEKYHPRKSIQLFQLVILRDRNIKNTQCSFK